MEVFDQVTVAPEESSVHVTFDRGLYPLDVIYGAAYVFIDRAFVLLDAPDTGRLRVSLRGRTAATADALKTLAGEFGNEVLAQLWRQETIRQNLSLIEVVTARALAGAQAPAADLATLPTTATAPGSIPAAAAAPEDLADAFDDPLGIAVPWEEKYGKKEGAATNGDDKK